MARIVGLRCMFKFRIGVNAYFRSIENLLAWMVISENLNKICIYSKWSEGFTQNFSRWPVFKDIVLFFHFHIAHLFELFHLRVRL